MDLNKPPIQTQKTTSASIDNDLEKLLEEVFDSERFAAEEDELNLEFREFDRKHDLWLARSKAYARLRVIV